MTSARAAMTAKRGCKRCINLGKGQPLRTCRDASTARANTELLHTNRLAPRHFGGATLIAFARKLRWARQIAPKLEPQPTDLRWGSQRFRHFRQKWGRLGDSLNDIKQ